MSEVEIEAQARRAVYIADANGIDEAVSRNGNFLLRAVGAVSASAIAVGTKHALQHRCTEHVLQTGSDAFALSDRT